ncbi:MAG: dimethylarginine dimethylaminohydrolase family protein [Candidatus Gastranaerophilales bacterium]|nr:dimethylarginine dimethylaminohydrolase family protein [Candidatus Gastranaerophilales bacterium]
MAEKILMCSPEHYGIKYEINPWMNVNIQADNSKAVAQWQALYKILKDDLGVDLRLVEPREDVPDMVFTANAAVMYGNKAVISRFKYPERQKEEKYFADWFEANGYEVITLPDDMAFEGAGDALYLDGILYAGYVPRTDIASHTYISELLKIPVISMELVNKSFYHVDTCFCPLEDNYLIYYPEAFDEYANKVIEQNVPPEKRIIANKEEASYFSCNAVNIGDVVVTNLTTQRFANLLKEKGFNHIQTDLSEFMKAGGAAKCLTLKI